MYNSYENILVSGLKIPCSKASPELHIGGALFIFLFIVYGSQLR